MQETQKMPHGHKEEYIKVHRAEEGIIDSAWELGVLFLRGSAFLLNFVKAILLTSN